MANVVVCPTCARKLRLPDHLLGKEVRCPGCNRIFAAERSSGRESARDDEEDSEELDGDQEETDRPSRRRRSVRNNQQPHRGGLLLTLGIVSLATGILAVPAEFGLGLCTLCCPLGAFAMIAAGVLMVIGLGCGIPAVVMAPRDLRMMGEETRDPAGRGMTMGGLVCAIIGLILNVLSIIATVVLLVVYGAALFTSAAAGATTPNPAPGRPNPPGRKLEVPGNLPRLHDYLPTQVL
jgi:uncharacterized membrane protein HdeD (DUF308 family)